jgi:predicted SAM-dependent methyltransferase
MNSPNSCIKLNLGCGHIQAKGWENVDGSIRAWTASHLSWLDRFFVWSRLLSPTEFNKNTRTVNLNKKLPWKDNSIDVIYMGDVLEHFTREDGFRLLKECNRILKHMGILRVRVPDNARFWRNYLKEFDDAYAKPPSEWSEDHTRWIEMFFENICVRRRFLASYGHYHKWMYDEITMFKALERAGFKSIERRKLNDSAISDIEAVESREDLTVEARKQD